MDEYSAPHDSRTLFSQTTPQRPVIINASYQAFTRSNLGTKTLKNSST